MLEQNIGNEEIKSRKYLEKIILDYMQMKEFIEDPLIIHKGDGIRYVDVDGKKYIDGLSGVYVVNAGHNNKRIIKAIKKSIENFVFSPPMLGTNPEAIKLANLLSEIAPGNLNHAKLLSGGSEAVETAIKMAKQYHKLIGNNRKYKIISFYDSYHGATMGAMSATGKIHMRKFYEPLMPGFLQVNPPYCYRCFLELDKNTCNKACLKLIETIIEKEDPQSIAAFIMEPIRGPIVGIFPDEYIKSIREICKQHEIILIFDEIITGFGRTGELFAANTYGTIPDIMVCGKGMSSGYAPVAAAICDKKIYDAFYGESGKEFVHGHTYGCHQFSAAAGIASISEILERNLAGNAKKMESYVKEKLKKLDNNFNIIGDIRGRGLWIAAEIVKDKKTKESFSQDISIGVKLRKACIKNGLLIRTDPNWFAIAPPLIVEKNDIDEIFEILEKSIDEVLNSL
jgi:adenosylmethionine-8-amino-7-oxononanoate aminotransferase